MEGEVHNFVMVWTWVIACLCYCYYFTGKMVPKGFLRLLALLPVICIFLLLPLYLTSMHFVGITSFFIAWLANFKLLLFAFGLGPLAADPKIPLSRFLAVACLPIKVRRPHKPQISNGRPNGENHPPRSDKRVLNYGTKWILFALLLKAYDYSDYIHPKLILFLYCLHIYFCLEISLGLVGFLAKALLRIELEPQFNEPYLSTSLQDFWGRRWNLMVTNILRPTVYDPVRRASEPLLGRRWAGIPAVLGTFVVSAVMHELIYYYLGRLRPTWEITCFFLLHGVCLTAEIVLKKAYPGGAWLFPPVVSVPLTLGFVVFTGFWLFFPQLLRFKGDVRAFEEYAALGAFLKDCGSALASPRPPNATSAF